MSNQTTHQLDENGIYRQIVSPRVLRDVLDCQGSDYSRPDDFALGDEWLIE